jgi:hypothetical protein
VTRRGSDGRRAVAAADRRTCIEGERLRRWFRPLSIAALAAAALAAPARAQQQPPRTEVDTLAADTTDDRISPRTAFLRSLLVPGWGQASVGSYGRGAVFFAIQGSSTYMLFKTLAKLGQSRRVEDRVVGIVTDSLNFVIARDTAEDACTADPVLCEAARRLGRDPTAFETEVAADTAVSRIRNLVETREDQKQDWITYLLFFTMMSGVDAYVNRHLQDFPVDVLTTARPDGRYSVGVRLPLGGR